MMAQNIFGTSIKYVLIDLIGDVVKFPIWWYSAGLKKAAVFCWQKIKDGETALGLKIWLVNIFKPMFGQYDWQGRIISFFMRIVQIIFRTVALAVYLGFILVLFCLWLALPIVTVYKIISIIIGI